MSKNKPDLSEQNKKEETLLTGAPSIAAALPDDDEFDFLRANLEDDLEFQQFGALYPVIQWVNGAPDRKREGGIAYTGGFFVAAEQSLLVPGFEPYVLMTREGTEVKGYAARDLTCTVVQYRRSWTVQPDEGLAQRFAHEEYDDAVALGKARGAVHLLVRPRGLDECVIVSFRGMTAKSVAGMGKDRGIVPAFGQTIVNAANRLALKDGRKQGYPLCAFTLTMGPGRNEKDEPTFVEVGEKEKSRVTLPAWLDRPTDVVGAVEIRNRFVGKTALTENQAYYRDAEAWIEEWSLEKLGARRAKLQKKTAPETGANSAETKGLPASNEMPF